MGPQTLLFQKVTATSLLLFLVWSSGGSQASLLMQMNGLCCCCFVLLPGADVNQLNLFETSNISDLTLLSPL